jgi:hypothetical protein
VGCVLGAAFDTAGLSCFCGWHSYP